MNKQPDRKFQHATGSFVRASTGLSVLLAFLLVIPFTLWFTWARHSTMSEPVVLTFFCLSFAWLNFSILKWQRNFRKLGQSSSSRLLLGPRPDDPDEQLAWRWGRQFLYSFLAVLVCMLAFAITKWLEGDF
jgi:hypothetical protein